MGVALTQVFRFFHIMRRHDNRFTAVTEPFDDAPDVVPGLRIKAGGRLVQEQDLRVVHQRQADAEALFLPAGEFAHPAAAFIGEGDLLQNLAGGHRLPVIAAEEVDGLPDADIVVEAGGLELHPR
jgi:hypothetical protein